MKKREFEEKNTHFSLQERRLKWSLEILATFMF